MVHENVRLARLQLHVSPKSSDPKPKKKAKAKGTSSSPAMDDDKINKLSEGVKHGKKEQLEKLVSLVSVTLKTIVDLVVEE